MPERYPTLQSLSGLRPGVPWIDATIADAQTCIDSRVSSIACSNTWMQCAYSSLRTNQRHLKFKMLSKRHVNTLHLLAVVKRQALR